ncbi:DUF1345 domain-containing protein [Dongia sp.]|uniref:DUF1345 domain-containing protein n=1 Tax=Dongia sp. TaxID=1977262 RepID=UPI0035B0AD3E
MAQRRSRRTGLGSHVKGRQRLLAGAAVILVAYPLLAASGWSAALSSSIAWDAGILVYLTLSGLMMFSSTPERITRRARELDISLGEIVILTVLAAGFSLFAAARVLAQAKVVSGPLEPLYLATGAVSIVLSWFLVHTLFAIHYAHEFYNEGEGGKNAGGLDFPGGQAPDYWDFIYFAAVVAMTCQVSDVTIPGREMRHLVTAHGIVSFFLNTVILALSVGIAASLI